MNNPTLQQAMRRMTEHVEQLYRDNTEPDFDMTPMAHVFNARDESALVPVLEGNVFECVGLMLAVARGEGPEDARRTAPPEMLDFFADANMFVAASPAWTTEADEQGEPIGPRRSGEVVMILGETPNEQILASYKVTRNPLPVLEKMDKAAVGASHHKLLYQPTEH